MLIHLPKHQHHSIWFYIFEICYGLLQGGAAKIQALRIAQHLPISHFWWAAAMVLIAIGLVLSYKVLTHCHWREALKLGVSLLLIRFVTFTPWLNKLRGKRWFYTGQTSLQDRLIGKNYSWVWGVCLLAILFLQL